MVERLLWSGRQWCSNAPGQPAKASFSRGQDEKEAVAGTVAPTIGDEAWRDRFESVRRAGPAAEERQGRPRKTSGQEDRREGGKGGGSERELKGGDVPSRRVSPFTLLSYKGGYHSRWPQGRREGHVFFLFPPFSFPFTPLWGDVLSPHTARNGRSGERCGGWEGVFFLPVPYALEALTVINTFCFDWQFPHMRE